MLHHSCGNTRASVHTTYVLKKVAHVCMVAGAPHGCGRVQKSRPRSWRIRFRIWQVCRLILCANARLHTCHAHAHPTRTRTHTLRSLSSPLRSCRAHKTKTKNETLARRHCTSRERTQTSDLLWAREAARKFRRIEVVCAFLASTAMRHAGHACPRLCVLGSRLLATSSPTGVHANTHKRAHLPTMCTAKKRHNTRRVAPMCTNPHSAFCVDSFTPCFYQRLRTKRWPTPLRGYKLLYSLSCLVFPPFHMRDAHSSWERAYKALCTPHACRARMLARVCAVCDCMRIHLACAVITLQISPCLHVVVRLRRLPLRQVVCYGRRVYPRAHPRTCLVSFPSHAVTQWYTCVHVCVLRIYMHCSTEWQTLHVH